jgi:uncharacterized protein (TIGR03435 family)
MKKFILSMIALITLPAIVFLAQTAENLTGTWQGALKNPNGQLRIVIKISLVDKALKADLYSIDQQSPAIPASTITLEGSTVKLKITALNGTYEGKLSDDRNSITGTWSQGGPGGPLNLTRATPETAWAIPEPPAPRPPMARDADPSFEVATVKPSAPGRPGKLFTVKGADVLTINTTLNDLFTMAYNLHPKQIAGAPAWLESEKYDLTGRPDVPGIPSVDQMKIMIQKLLADRFQLKFHIEKKELAVYALTVTKSGIKFAKSQRDPNSLPGLFFGGPPPGTTLNVTNGTMAQFAGLMQGSVLDRPVADQTGLAEKYDFTLKWTPDPGQFLPFGGPPPAQPDAPDAPPDLFTAIQQQLGLRFESTKAPVDVFVVDRVEKPSEN